MNHPKYNRVYLSDRDLQIVQRALATYAKREEANSELSLVPEFALAHAEDAFDAGCLVNRLYDRFGDRRHWLPVRIKK